MKIFFFLILFLIPSFSVAATFAEAMASCQAVVPPERTCVDLGPTGGGDPPIGKIRQEWNDFPGAYN